MSRSLLFYAVAAVAAVLPLSFGASAAPPPAATEPLAVTPDPEFAAFGLELPALPGWRRVPETAGGMIARWTDEPADVKEPTHTLSIALEPANGKSAEKYVAAQIEQSGGQSAAAAVALGGEKAFWIFGQTFHQTWEATLVAAHGKYIYLIDGAADTRAHLPAGDMEKFARSLKFVEIAAPSKTVQLRDEPLTLEHFTFKPLATMRPGPEGESGGMLVLGSDNYAANQTECVMSAQTMRIKPNQALDAVGNEFFQKITEGQAPIRAWGFIRTKPQRAISAVIPSSYQGQPVTMRIGVVQISDSEVALLHFTITPPDAATRATYEKACEEIVRSVEPIAH